MNESRMMAQEYPGLDEKDALTDLPQDGARRMLAEAVETEGRKF